LISLNKTFSNDNLPTLPKMVFMDLWKEREEIGN